jgi:3-oxoacyl-[acyl-carrier protein] reductase
MGRESLVVKADVTKSKEVEHMVEESISHFGRIDILINNAGVAGEYIGKPIVDMTEDEWDIVVETSLKGTFLVTKFVARVMIKQQEGRIINTSSVYGQSGGRPGVANYASAKSGIIGFTKTAALELSKYGITVNAVSPGFVETELSRTLPIKEELVKQIPLRRFARPEEIGRVIAFLASPHAAYITGSVVEVNGGRIEFQFP